MGVSTTHRINLSMWILIYSFSDTYYVWAACDLLSDVEANVKTLETGEFYSEEELLKPLSTGDRGKKQ